jgi:hypothetical protein
MARQARGERQLQEGCSPQAGTGSAFKTGVEGRTISEDANIR